MGHRSSDALDNKTDKIVRAININVLNAKGDIQYNKTNKINGFNKYLSADKKLNDKDFIKLALAMYGAVGKRGEDNRPAYRVAVKDFWTEKRESFIVDDKAKDYVEQSTTTGDDSSARDPNLLDKLEAQAFIIANESLSKESTDNDIITMEYNSGLNYTFIGPYKIRITGAYTDKIQTTIKTSNGDITTCKYSLDKKNII